MGYITDVVLLSSEDFPLNLLKKMKIVILLLAVLATINAAAVQNVKAADKPAAVKAADLPKPAEVEVEDLPEAEEAEDREEGDLIEDEAEDLIEDEAEALMEDPR